MPESESACAAAIAERAFERKSDDETLRGTLQDDGYGPLLDFIERLALATADRFRSTDAPYLALRSLLVAAIRSAERGDVSDLAATLIPFYADQQR